MKIPRELGDEWEHVRNDTLKANWMICGISSDGKTAELFQKGTDGLDTFVSLLPEDKVLFGGLRCRAVDDRGTLKSVRAKFIFVTWLGKKVSAVQRARAGTLRVEFAKLFDGCHIAIQTDDKDDFTEAELTKKLQSSTGAHKPTGYEFFGNDNEEGLVDAPADGSVEPKKPEEKKPEEKKPEEKKPEAKKPEEKKPEEKKPEEKKPEEKKPEEKKPEEKKPEEKKPEEKKPEEKKPEEKKPEEKKPEAKKPEVKVEKDAPASPGSSSPKFSTGGSPAEVWEEIRDGKTPLTWMTLSYDGKNPKTMYLYRKGKTGMQDFLDQLEEDKILFCGIRCRAIDDRGTVKSVRNKFIFLAWIGNDVKPMVRAKVSTHKTDFQKLIGGTHISLHTGDKDDLSAKELEHKLQASTGAHKPTGYDFSGGLLDGEEEEEEVEVEVEVEVDADADAEEAAVAAEKKAKEEEAKKAKEEEEKKAKEEEAKKAKEEEEKKAKEEEEKKAKEEEEKKAKEEKEEEKEEADEKDKEEEKKDSAPAPAPAPAPKAGGPPPPPPPPPPADFLEKLCKKSSGDDGDAKARAALFADIAKGTDITKGLKKVDRSEMRHKNRDEKELGKATDFSELEKKKAARQEELAKKQAAAQGVVKKAAEPKMALEGKQWKIENQVGSKLDRKHDKLEDVNMSQAVTLTDCENYLLEITGKVNMVTINDCKNVGVMMKDVVSGCEISKGTKVEVQAGGKLPSFILDRCNEVMLYTTDDSRDVEITACASTCVNVTFPDEKGGDADPIEKPLPEQFVTRVVMVDGVPKLETKPMEHAG